MDRKIHPLKARSRFKARLLFGMVLKPLRLFCQHCDKYMPSDMEWRCAHCGHENWATKYYSFLNKCQNCKRPPKSVACPHCGKLNFLDRDGDGSHPAVRIFVPVPQSPLVPPVPPIIPPTTAQVRAVKRENHADRKEAIQQEIEIAKLNADLVRCKESAEFREELKRMAKLIKNFSEHEADVMGVKMVVKKKRSEYAETFKDDPEGLQDANDSLGMWAEKQTITPLP